MASAAAMCAEAAARTLAAATEAIERRGRFVVVLAGGNTPRALYESLRGADADWARWHVYFGDERCAPADDPERNSLMAASAWLDHVPIPAAQRHPIPAELGPLEAARRYAATLPSRSANSISSSWAWESVKKATPAASSPATTSASCRRRRARSRYKARPSRRLRA